MGNPRVDVITQLGKRLRNSLGNTYLRRHKLHWLISLWHCCIMCTFCNLFPVVAGLRPPVCLVFADSQQKRSCGNLLRGSEFLQGVLRIFSVQNT
jgi:hypothetical protein